MKGRRSVYEIHSEARIRETAVSGTSVGELQRDRTNELARNTIRRPTRFVSEGASIMDALAASSDAVSSR